MPFAVFIDRKELFLQSDGLRTAAYRKDRAAPSPPLKNNTYNLN